MSGTLYFCPECGSPSIERSALSGGNASCRACSWAGTSDRLAAMPITGKTGEEDKLLINMVGDLRTVLARDVGVVLVKFLSKWGFLTTTDRQILAKQAGRYIAAAARGIMVALIEERDKMEVERARGS